MRNVLLVLKWKRKISGTGFPELWVFLVTVASGVLLEGVSRAYLCMRTRLQALRTIQKQKSDIGCKFTDRDMRKQFGVTMT